VCAIVTGVVFLIAHAALLSSFMPRAWLRLAAIDPAVYIFMIVPALLPLALVLFGISDLFNLRWTRRVVAPYERALRNHYRKRFGQQFLNDLESYRLWIRLRTNVRSLPRMILSAEQPPPLPGSVLLSRIFLAHMQYYLIVLFAPVFVLAAAGLAAPPYAGPQPPTSMLQWAHMASTNAATMMFSRAGVLFLSVCAFEIVMYLRGQHRLRRLEQASMHS